MFVFLVLILCAGRCMLVVCETKELPSPIQQTLPTIRSCSIYSEQAQLQTAEQGVLCSHILTTN